MALFEKVLKSLIDRESDNRLQRDIDYENQVREDGVDYASKRIMDILNDEITSKDLAKQFVLEELDAAIKGNEYAKDFAKNSGFKSYEYVGALNRTRWKGEESELERIQLFIREAFIFPIRDIDLMVKLSTAVLDRVMQRWELGKYINDLQLNEDDIIEQLHLLSENNSLKMHGLDVMATNGDWDWSFKFSDNEFEQAMELIDSLRKIRNGDFAMLPYRINNTN